MGKAIDVVEQPLIGDHWDGRRIDWVQAFRVHHRAANGWARGYELVRHRLETQERVFRMVEQLAARGISGNGLPVFEVLSAADQLASAAMALVLQQTCAKANPVLRTDSVSSATGIPDHAAAALNMVPAYVGYLSINALTGQTRPWLMEGESGADAVDAVDHHRSVVADAHLPAGDVLGVEDPTGEGAPAWRPPLVAFLNIGDDAYRQLAAFSERWRRSGGKAVTPILISESGWIGSFAVSRPASLERFMARLRGDGFDPIVIDGRDPAAFAWAIFEVECRLEATGDALPCSCHPSQKLVPCAVAVPPAAAPGPEDQPHRSFLPNRMPVLAVSRRPVHAAGR